MSRNKLSRTFCAFVLTFKIASATCAFNISKRSCQALISKILDQRVKNDEKIIANVCPTFTD